MSPDPPTENTSDDNELTNGGPHNFFILNEDDIGEGDHELDFSSHESEMTTDDEEDMQNVNETEGEGENGNMRVRAQYQMLIPFTNGTETGEAGIQEFHQVDSPMDDDDEDDVGNAEPGSHAHAAVVTEESSTQVTQDEPKREITLSSEKVETIKDVMKNFTLPSTSIPVWAKEVSEDVWKSKLISKIDSSTGAGKPSGKS